MTTLVDTAVFQPLTLEERGRREELIETIVIGEVATLRSGKALREVRDRRLYRDTHSSLEAWAEEICRVSRARVYQLIEFANVHEAANEQGIEVSNERMARALGVVPPADYQLVIDVTRATTGKTHPSSADIQAVADTNRMMADGMAVEHPQTGEPVRYTDLPPEQRAPALATAVQRGSQDRRDFQGTDDVKPWDWLDGLRSGADIAVIGEADGWHVDSTDRSTGEKLSGPVKPNQWDAIRAARAMWEGEIQP